MANYIMNKVSEAYNSVVQKIGETSFFTGLLQMAEDRTGISSAYIAACLSTAILLFFVLGYGTIIMFDFVVVWYPAYKSFQAMEDENPDALAYWMKYWIVFGLFTTLEPIGDSLLWWTPGYTLVKFFFLLWCLAPLQYNGSVILYNYIRETFMRYKETVDDAIAAVKSLTNLSPIHRRQ